MYTIPLSELKGTGLSMRAASETNAGTGFRLPCTLPGARFP